jgi:hypothetical protein
MSPYPPAICVKNPGKKYALGGMEDHYLTLRDFKKVNFSEGTVKAIQPDSPGRRVPERSRMCRLMGSKGEVLGNRGSKWKGSGCFPPASTDRN